MNHTFTNIKQLIQSDLYRYTGGKHFVKTYRSCEGFKYSVWFRIATGLQPKKWKYAPLYFFSRKYLHYLMHKYGITLDVGTSVGPGLYIGHFGCIVVNGSAIIGKNFNISQGVTIGQSNRGMRQGVPVIGDNVYIGPGAKIFGSIKIGNNVAIGANAVVTKDVPDDGVAVGIPAKVISHDGSTAYVENRV